MPAEKRTGDRLPNPVIGKTSRYNRLVRFIDLNRVIGDVNFENSALNTIEELKGVEVEDRPYGSYFNVLGYNKPNDLGGGLFFWDPESEEDQDNGLVIKSNHSSTGRWYRVIEDYVTPEMFGAVGDGATDDTEAFRAAVNSDLGYVQGRKGSIYKITKEISLKSYSTIENCRFLLPLNAISDKIFSTTSDTEYENLTIDIDENSLSITVADGSIYQEDQFLFMRNDETWAQRQSITKGEILQIKSVDGNTLNLKWATLNSYDVSNGGRLRRWVDPISNVEIKNCEATSEKDNQTTFAFFRYCDNIRIINCKTYNFDYTHYDMRTVHNYVFDNCYASKSSTLDGSNYGILHRDGSFSGKVLNSYGDNLRHFSTIGGNLGVNRKITVDNCTVTDSRDAGIDAHGSVWEHTFINNYIEIGSESAGGVRDGIISQGGCPVIKGNTIHNARNHGVSVTYYVNPELSKPTYIDVSDNKCFFSLGMENTNNSVISIVSNTNQVKNLDFVTITNNRALISSGVTLEYFIRVDSEFHSINGLNINDNVLSEGICNKGIYVDTITNSIKNISIKDNNVYASTGDAISVKGISGDTIDNVVVGGNLILGGVNGITLDYVDNVFLLGNRYSGVGTERNITNTTNLLNYDV